MKLLSQERDIQKEQVKVTACVADCSCGVSNTLPDYVAAMWWAIVHELTHRTVLQGN